MGLGGRKKKMRGWKSNLTDPPARLPACLLLSIGRLYTARAHILQYHTCQTKSGRSPTIPAKAVYIRSPNMISPHYPRTTHRVKGILVNYIYNLSLSSLQIKTRFVTSQIKSRPQRERERYYKSQFTNLFPSLKISLLLRI